MHMYNFEPSLQYLLLFNTHIIIFTYSSIKINDDYYEMKFQLLNREAMLKYCSNLRVPRVQVQQFMSSMQ